MKLYRPTTPGRRSAGVLDYAELTRTSPEKALTKAIRKTAGRNNQGHITSRFRGGGHHRIYRKIDFKRDKDNVSAKVLEIEYDPNRTCNIALIQYADGEKRYILAPEGIKQGRSVVSGEKVEPEIGNAMPLENIPLGLQVHNVELCPGQGGRMARSAGMCAILLSREGEHAHLQLPSGEIRMVNCRCRATIGQIGNADHSNIRIGKAGRKRHMGRRPHVRGTAMNPVSHPHGGGEGRTKGGRHPCSPTGVPAKGGKTRQRRKPSSRFILRRRRT